MSPRGSRGDRAHQSSRDAALHWAPRMARTALLVLSCSLASAPAIAQNWRALDGSNRVFVGTCDVARGRILTVAASTTR